MSDHQPSTGPKQARLAPPVGVRKAGCRRTSAVVIADDTMKADRRISAGRCEGTALLCAAIFRTRGSVAEMSRRADRKPQARPESVRRTSGATAWRSTCIARLSRNAHARWHDLIAAGWRLHHLAAPCAGRAAACTEAYGIGASFRGSRCANCCLIGAHEWRKKGVEIAVLGVAGLGARIHPHYGVYSRCAASMWDW